MVFSETCEFFGGSNILDLSMSNALLDAGARAVVGFVNNVYAVYSRSMLWGTVNQLIMGKNILQAVDAAAAAYGPDDIYWYLSQGGAKPHRYAAFALRRHLLVSVAGRRQTSPVRGFCPGPRGRHRHPLHSGPKRGGVTRHPSLNIATKIGRQRF